MIKEAIEKIVNKQDLTYEEAFEVMNEIMDGATSQTQNAAFQQKAPEPKLPMKYRVVLRRCVPMPHKCTQAWMSLKL